MSSKTASFMRWHAKSCIDDCVLRHPTDNPAWKSFDQINIDFVLDIGNVRLGLESNSLNQFRTMSASNCKWPVLLIPYNLPPWMCTKQPFTIFICAY